MDSSVTPMIEIQASFCINPNCRVIPASVRDETCLNIGSIRISQMGVSRISGRVFVWLLCRIGGCISEFPSMKDRRSGWFKRKQVSVGLSVRPSVGLSVQTLYRTPKPRLNSSLSWLRLIHSLNRSRQTQYACTNRVAQTCATTSP